MQRSLSTSLGRSGAAGTDVEIFFELLQYPKLREEVFYDLAGRVVDANDIPFIPGRWIEQQILKRAFTWLADMMTGDRCQHGDAACTNDIAQGIRKYLFGPTFQQLRDEIGRVPNDLSFVFGHTHKPFVSRMRTPGNEVWVNIYNTGGWTVDAAHPHPTSGGAVVLANCDLQLASLRIYNETADHEVGAVKIEQVEDAAPEDVAFRLEIERRLGGSGDSGTAEEWQELAGRISAAIRERRAHHREKFT